MKLLGWMHRKFKQNNGEPLKDFVIGQQPSDEQQYFPRTSFNKPFKQAQRRELNLRKSDEHYEEESSLLSISEIFPGFLAIGTLGSSEPATPKFSISIDFITEGETEVTENELKLINDELEKVLEAEAKDDRGSRPDSHGGSGKVFEGTENSNNVVNGSTVVCPLQGYLFGSAVEMSKTTTMAMAKKEKRTSLGELLQRSKLADDQVGGEKCEKEEEDKLYGMQLIKKKLKKKMLSAAFRSSAAAAAPGGDLNVSTKTKLHKIRQLFNRKVYPESTIMAKEKWDHEAQKINDKKKKTTITIDGEDRTSTDEDIMIFPKKLILKQTLQSYNSHSTPPQFDDEDDQDEYWDNEEQWIKTNADYLVLEL